jgi:hypothetical protein
MLLVGSSDSSLINGSVRFHLRGGAITRIYPVGKMGKYKKFVVVLAVVQRTSPPCQEAPGDDFTPVANIRTLRDQMHYLMRCLSPGRCTTRRSSSIFSLEFGADLGLRMTVQHT